MNKNEILNNIENESFIANNGLILRTFNILEAKYRKLQNMQKTLLHNDGVTESEFVTSINFLESEKYIELRTISEHEAVTLADHDYSKLEARISSKGTRLLRGGIKDNMIEV